MSVAGVVLVLGGAALLVTSAIGGSSTGAPTTGPSTSVAGVTAALPTDDGTGDRPPRSFTLVATGELLVQDAVRDRAAAIGSTSGARHDFGPMFDLVRERLSRADVALCHLTTPLARAGEPVGGDGLVAPAELATAIAAAGYDVCSTASDHAFDAGPDGVAATLDELDRVGVLHTGTTRDGAAPAAPAVVDVGGGVSVANLAYTFDAGPDGEGADRYVSASNPLRIVADARAARAAGASVVVVSIHWGERFESDPTPEQLALVDALRTIPEVDLVVGHHAHVVQPLVRAGDLMVAYGLGNFLSAQGESACCPAASGDGVVVELRFEETGAGSGEFRVSDAVFQPTTVDPETFTIVPVTDALLDPSLPERLRSAYEASRARTTGVLGRLGAVASEG